jgi:ACT domain-containing protein
MNKDVQDRTAVNRQLMIEQLRKTPIVQVACEKTSVARSTYYRWREEDSEFAKQADKALAEGVALVNDMAESQLLSAIRDRNISAIFYWLNHRHSAYSNKLEITAKVKNEVMTPEQAELIKKALENANLIMKGEDYDDTSLK